jgi:hypothetical protein
MTTVPVRIRRRSSGAEHPVELRFIDMLLIIIAVTVMASVVSIRTGEGRAAAALSVATSSVPAALAGKPYRVVLPARGGDGVYRWQMAGTLPPDLTLTEEGAIEGTPQREGSDDITVKVTDRGGAESNWQRISVKVEPSRTGAVEQVRPWIASDLTLLKINPGMTDFKHSVKRGNGTTPIRWSSAALPKWLTLSPDGELTLRGEPQPGDSTFEVTATDAVGLVATQQTQISVEEEPDNLFWRVLGWLRTIITWLAYLLLALVGGRLIWEGVVGHSGYVIQPKQGWINRRRGRY